MPSTNALGPSPSIPHAMVTKSHEANLPGMGLTPTELRSDEFAEHFVEFGVEIGVIGRLFLNWNDRSPALV